MEDNIVITRPFRAIFASGKTILLLSLLIITVITDGFIKPANIFDPMWYSIVPIIGSEITEIIYKYLYYITICFSIGYVFIDFLRIKIERIVINDNYMQIKTGILFRVDDDIFYKDIRSLDPVQTPMESLLNLKDYRILVEGAQSDMGSSEIVNGELSLVPQSRITIHRMDGSLYKLIQDRRINNGNS
jgi:uncharacterized membrane protein YdbT with pleckstrin-like domain